MEAPDSPEHRRGQRNAFAGLFVGYCLLAGSRAGVTVASSSMMLPVAVGGFGLDKQGIGMIQSAFTMTWHHPLAPSTAAAPPLHHSHRRSLTTSS